MDSLLQVEGWEEIQAAGEEVEEEKVPDSSLKFHPFIAQHAYLIKSQNNVFTPPLPDIPVLESPQCEFPSE